MRSYGSSTASTPKVVIPYTMPGGAAGEAIRSAAPHERAFSVQLANASGAVTLTNVTLTNNTADSDANEAGDGGGLVQTSGATVNVQNTLIAGNVDNSGTTPRADCWGTFTSQGNNLIGNNTGCTGFTPGVNGDQVGTGGSPLDPQVGALAGNGGATLTHALLTGSPAINAGTNVGCPATDQRGYTRDAVCDIGAYEYGAVGAAGGATLSSALDTSSIQLARFATAPRVLGDAPAAQMRPLLDPPPVTEIVTKTYYYAGASLIAMRVLTGTTGITLYYLHADHLGSTSLTTSDTGAVVARQWYYPYGTVRASSGTLPTDITFTGQRAESSGLGSLMFFRARYYSPLVGRFLSADSIVPGAGNPQNLNRYSYVLNSPLKYMDPTGHKACDDIDENGQCSVDPEWQQNKTGNKSDPVTLSQSDPQPLIDYTPYTEHGDDAREYLEFYIYYTSHLPAEWGPGEFTIEEFLGLMMLYERYGAYYLEDYLVEAVQRQLWTGDEYTASHYGGPYCTASPCFNGALNFLARYSESAHRQFDGGGDTTVPSYKAGTLVISLPGEQGAYYNDIHVSNVRQKARDLGHRALNPPPGLKFDTTRPYHFGNLTVAPPISFGRSYGNFYITPP